MKKFIPFTKIGQYRQVVDEIVTYSNFAGLNSKGQPIYDESRTKPILEFTGTIKLAGSLGAISYNIDEGIWAQSKEKIITPENDNYGFASFVEENKNLFLNLFENRLSVKKNEILTIFGEWIGKSIQKNVSTSEMEKSFVIFSMKSTQFLPDGKEEIRWYKNKEFFDIRYTENRIYNIYDYPTWTIKIDFNNPKKIQEELIEIANLIENECPFAKEFGISAKGEGVVFTSMTSKYKCLRFKVKNTKNPGFINKKKLRVAIDPIKLKSIEDFVKYSVHEDRLEQGLEKIFLSKGRTINIKKIENFLKWIVKDILEEEKDVLEKSNLEIKDVSKQITNVARNWFMNKLNENYNSDGK